MKKSSTIKLIFIILVIIAMIKMSSFMSGLGFVLSIVIGSFGVMLIVGAIYLFYESFHSDGDIFAAIGKFIGAIVLIFIGFKILTWLIGVLW